MNNQDVEQELNKCWSELNNVKSLIDSAGVLSSLTPYLTKYAIIRSCGVLETSFKTIIADFCSDQSKEQVKRFIRVRVREGSANPSFKNICTTLKNFDPVWNKNFKLRLDGELNKPQILTSLESLVEARNVFAHGGSPTGSIADILTYFQHSRRIIELLDEVVR